MHRLNAPFVALTAPALLLASFAARSSSGDVWTQEQLEEETARIEDQVAALRGEAFQRQVAVELTDGPGFLRHAKERLETMTSEAALAAEEDTAKLLGLVPPSMDLWAATFDLLEGQVGGFYDPAADTFYLMDTFTGGVARIILAHELTHALDDQLYDIDGTLEPLMTERDAAAAYQAVVEGSGTAMMTRWMLKHGSELSQEELVEVSRMGTEGLKEAPLYLWKPLLAAYATGNAFLDRGYRVLKKQGKDFSDVTRMAFESPPRSTEQVLHPNKYWKETEVDEPIELRLEGELPEGWERLDETTLGELALAVMTDESEPVDFENQMAIALMKYTNEAATGWGGDRVVLVGKGDARVLCFASAWDSAEDAREFEEALERRLEPWSAAVRELGQGRGGVQIQGPDEESPASVRFRVWSGVDSDEAARVAGSLSAAR